MTGFNLETHCAKSLLGVYSKKVNNYRDQYQGVKLNEANATFYYLCGVTTPYRWDKNLHIAFEYSEGDRILRSWNGDEILISDAKEIIIKDLGEYNLHPKGVDKVYNSCRNWRFAYQNVNQL